MGFLAVLVVAILIGILIAVAITFGPRVLGRTDRGVDTDRTP